MKVLNLYAGIGGNRKLWGDVEVTAVENDATIAAVYQKLYPNDKVIVADAHQYLLEHFQEFDFIWSSPPCPSHSRARLAGLSYKFPDMKLYEEIIFLNQFYKGNWVVENVIPYYEPLVKPKEIIDRHMFWSNRWIPKLKTERVYTGRIINQTKEVLALQHGIELPGGTKDQRKLLRNAVDPKVGLHVFHYINITEGNDLAAQKPLGPSDVANPQSSPQSPNHSEG